MPSVAVVFSIKSAIFGPPARRASTTCRMARMRKRKKHSQPNCFDRKNCMLWHKSLPYIHNTNNDETRRTPRTHSIKHRCGHTHQHFCFYSSLCAHRTKTAQINNGWCRAPFKRVYKRHNSQLLPLRFLSFPLFFLLLILSLPCVHCSLLVPVSAGPFVFDPFIA